MQKSGAGTLVPINSFIGECPVYVNPKQYDAILRRRAKKVGRETSEFPPRAPPRVRYQKRSLHAQRRPRTQSGKFAAKPRAEQKQIDCANATLSDAKRR